MQQNRVVIHPLCVMTLLALCWLLVACMPVIQPPADNTESGNAAGAESPAVQEARQDLAQALQIDAAAITILSEEAVEWPDACLGAPAADEMCAQMITPGYRVALSVDGLGYLYHTNADGSELRQVINQDATGALPGGEEMTFFVESVEVRILESAPVQVEAVVRGQLVDACVTIVNSTVEVQEQRFVVTLETARPADKMCAQVLTPFEQVVPLELPAGATGAFEVQAGDVVQSFTLKG